MKYKSQTTVEGFPNGFGEVTVVMAFRKKQDIFKAFNLYKIEGMDRYLLLNECADNSRRRYFKAWISDSITGPWYDLAPDVSEPFCGEANVEFEHGVESWTKDFSHGELLRAGYDQTMTISVHNLKFLFQGMSSIEDAVPA